MQDDLLLPARSPSGRESRDLDPFTDSLELEYSGAGGFNFTDGRPHPQSNAAPPMREPRPHMQTARPMSQIMEEPMDMQQDGTTSFDTGYISQSGDYTFSGSHMTGHVTGGDAISDYTAGGFVPPPPYRAAVDGSDGAVSSGRGSDENLTDLSGETERIGAGGYWLRRRN